MSKVEKAYDTRVSKVANAIAKKITHLVAPVTDEQVLDVLREHACSKRVLSDAFTVLDKDYRLLCHHETWHPRLRRLRNNTELGQQMFALFQ